MRPNYNDMDSVTNTGVSTKVSQKLAVQKPAQDIKVTSATYYITGTSNPNESLYVNGQQVTNRGKYGSFGVFVSLELGDNVFNFQNGDATDSVTLTPGGFCRLFGRVHHQLFDQPIPHL